MGRDFKKTQDGLQLVITPNNNFFKTSNPFLLKMDGKDFSYIYLTVQNSRENK